LTYKLEEEKVRFSISDTGIGIPTDQHEKIFERFAKVNSFSQGSGLGLSICKTIINKLQGEIGLHSLPGKGSTFWFTLPLNQELKESLITKH